MLGRGAIDDHARCEVAVIKIRIRFFIRRHHLVDLVAKNASHIRDECRERPAQRQLSEGELPPYKGKQAPEHSKPTRAQDVIA